MGGLLLIFPLNWARLYALGEVPPGTSPSSVLIVGAVVLALALLLMWYGPPVLRETVTAGGNGKPGGGLISRVATSIREAREQAAARKEEERALREQELENARTGDLVPIDSGTVVLQKGETAFSSIPASLLEFRTVRYRGRSTGVSVRVAKGVWLRQSGSRGTAEKGLVAVARGTLVVTNRRLIFAGDNKSAAVPLSQISSFEAMKDGLRIGDSRKTYNFLTSASHYHTVFVTIADRLLQDHG